MAAAVHQPVAIKAASLAAGRSHEIDFAAGYVSPMSYNQVPSISSPFGSKKKLSSLTSAKSLSNVSAGSSGLSSSSKSDKQIRLRASLRHINTNMSSYTSTTTIPASTTRPDSRLRLHKRDGSGSSLPPSASPLSGTHSQFTTPFSTSEEPFPDISSEPPPPSSTPKIKPYLRKFASATREDENQGRLDLSKSTSGNGAAGLGIQEFGSGSASDVSFLHTSRRAPHARTTSTGSLISIGPGPMKPTQPFLHPMRQTPNVPLTPSASSLNDDEVNESSDIVTDDDVQVGQAFRNRNLSISSTPLTQPTPLSQSHTAAELGELPKLTNINNSQTNLSINSGVSSSRSKPSRPRRDTERSEGAASPSARESFDNLFASRRSDPDPQTRDARIRAARRAFEEKEASKDRKMEQGVLKRRETDETKTIKMQQRQRGMSEASQSDRTRMTKFSSKGSDSKKSKGSSSQQSDELRARSYEDNRPPQATALPILGREPGMSEKTMRQQTQRSNISRSTWQRFSTWLQTRILSCGEKG